MKALSVQQPYAWLMLQRADPHDPHRPLKPILNRNWPLPKTFKVPQRVLVHAGMRMYDVSIKTLQDILPASQWARCRSTLTAMYGTYYLYRRDPALLRLPCHFGKIIGEITITGQVTAETLSLSDEIWFFGPYGFTLFDPVLYERPVPWLGKLGFFEVDACGVAINDGFKGVVPVV